MKNRLTIIILFLCFISTTALTQSRKTFILLDKESQKPLCNVFCIYNDTILSPAEGNTFNINCNNNDSLIFQKNGYLTQTVIIDSLHHGTKIMVKLLELSNTLPEVSIFADYVLTPQMIANANYNVKIAVYQASRINILSEIDDPYKFNLDNIISKSGYQGISSSQSFSVGIHSLKYLNNKAERPPQKKIISHEEYMSERINK